MVSLRLLCMLFSIYSGNSKASANTMPSIRVTKALGSRGYDKVRVSLINQLSECDEGVYWAMNTGIHSHPEWYPGLNATSAFNDFRTYMAKKSLHHCLVEGQEPSFPQDGVAWSYSAPFRHRWAQYYLRSAIVPIIPGEDNKLSLDGHEVQIKVPLEGTGSVGLLIGDPCIVYDKTYCKHTRTFQVKHTLQAVLNSMAKHGELDYWLMFGDLFYDKLGSITQDFFEGLSKNASSSILGVTLGNHDYWLGGSPSAADHSDSFGNGHMQWYAQDTVSAKHDEAQPFNFDADPAKYEIADISNSFWYYTVGNVALVGFSSSYDWDASLPYFREACSWIGSTKPALAVLVGHWNSENSGCVEGMGTESVFARVQRLAGCDTLGTRIKFVEGHKHCNQIKQNNTGFLLGSFGFSDSDTSCSGAFGLPILDTRDGWARLYYFELGSFGQRADNFDTIIECFKEKGFSMCMSYAQLWMEEPINTISPSLSVRPELATSSRTNSSLGRGNLRGLN
jgi:hypothetical protein